MRNICIIPTGKPKLWDKYPEIGKLKAMDAYTGTFHRLAKDYASHFFTEWYMISPKYGFLQKGDYIQENYDCRMNTFTKEQLQRYLSLLSKQKEVLLGQPDQIVVLGGKKFHPLFRKLYENNPNVLITFPLTGATGIGAMQQKLKNAVILGCQLH